MAPRPPIRARSDTTAVNIGNYASDVDTTGAGDVFTGITGGGSGLSGFHPIRSAVDFVKNVGRGFRTKFRQAKAYTSDEPQNALDLQGRKQSMGNIKSQIASKSATNKGYRNLSKY